MMKEYRKEKNHAQNKSLEERNAVNDELGLHILNRALGITESRKLNQLELDV